MSQIFTILMAIAMVLVLLSLGIGLFGMARGGEFGRKYGNRLMRIRVFMQGVALLFFALALLSGQNGS